MAEPGAEAIPLASEENRRGKEEEAREQRSGWLGRLLRAPALHFLAIGAAAFALLPEPRPVIVLDVSEIKQLRQSWVATRGLPPTPSQEAALIERAIEDEILLREGWSRGVPEEDPVVAERLKRIGRFVSQHGEEEALEGSDAVERAKELGLDRGDVVIRRYLIAMMRLAIGREADWSLPTEEEIEAHLRNHPERFAWPPRVELTHVFVSSRRGEEREESARQLLAELASMPPEKAGELGDPFPRGREFLAATPELGRIFGKAFAKEVEGLEVGVWSGPIQSAYGSHLVWVHQRLPETLPALDQVRSQVVHHLLRVRREGHLRQRLGELRDRYEIRVAGARWEGAALRRPSAAPEIAFEDGSCEITDPAGHPVIVMADDDQGDLHDRGSARN